MSTSIENVQNMLVNDLRAELKSRGASTIGKKAELVSRLIDILKKEEGGQEEEESLYFQDDTSSSSTKFAQSTEAIEQKIDEEIQIPKVESVHATITQSIKENSTTMIPIEPSIVMEEESKLAEGPITGMEQEIPPASETEKSPDLLISAIDAPNAIPTIPQSSLPLLEPIEADLVAPINETKDEDDMGHSSSSESKVMELEIAAPIINSEQPEQPHHQHNIDTDTNNATDEQPIGRALPPPPPPPLPTTIVINNNNNSNPTSSTDLDEEVQQLKELVKQRPLLLKKSSTLTTSSTTPSTTVTQSTLPQTLGSSCTLRIDHFQRPLNSKLLLQWLNDLCCTSTAPYTSSSSSSSSGFLFNEESIWINTIKTHCYLQCPDTAFAAYCKERLHGQRYPMTNTMTLAVYYTMVTVREAAQGAVEAGLKPGEAWLTYQQQQLMAAGSSSGSQQQPSSSSSQGNKKRKAEEEAEDARERQEKIQGGNRIKEDNNSNSNSNTSSNNNSSNIFRKAMQETTARRSNLNKLASTAGSIIPLAGSQFRKTASQPSLYWLPVSMEIAERRKQIKLRLGNLAQNNNHNNNSNSSNNHSCNSGSSMAESVKEEVEVAADDTVSKQAEADKEEGVGDDSGNGNDGGNSVVSISTSTVIPAVVDTVADVDTAADI